MKYLNSLYILIIFFSFSGNLLAQETEETLSIPDIGSYSIIVLNSEIGKNIYFFTQGRIHHHDLFKNQKQFLVRTAIEYKFSKAFKVHIGYASVDKQPFDKDLIADFEIQKWFYDEFQFTIGSKEKIQLKARFRHERRWITPNDEIDTFQDDRLRFRLTAIKNLGHKFYAKLFSEAFYSVENKELSKLRNNLSFGTQLSKELKFEVGVIDEGKVGNSKTFLVTRLYINTSWRSEQTKTPKKEATNEIPIEEVKEVPKEILLDSNQKLSNIIEDHPIDLIQKKRNDNPETLDTTDLNSISLKNPNQQSIGLESQHESSSLKVLKEHSISNEFEYHIIVSSNKDFDGAQTYVDQLKSLGYYKARVLPDTYNSYYRVSAAYFSSETEARESLTELKNNHYTSAWLFKTEKLGHFEKLTPDQLQTIQDTSIYERSTAAIPYRPVHHVVSASTNEIDKAKEILKELHNKGFINAYMLESGPNGTIRISAAHFKKKTDTKAAVELLAKSGHKGAWVYTIN